MSNFHFCLRSCWGFDRSQHALRCRPTEARWLLRFPVSAVLLPRAPVVTVTRRAENIYSVILCLVSIFPLLSVANLLHLTCNSAYFLCTFLAFYTDLF